MLQKNFLLHEHGKQYHWEGTGSLSIKTFRNGKALYDVGRGLYAVDDSCYLILNQGQRYSITIDSDSRLESFCIFFKDGFVEGVNRSLTWKADRLLEDPEFERQDILHFVEKNYPHEEILSPALVRLRAASSNDPAWLEEQFHDLAERLLLVHTKVQCDMDRVSAIRTSTREELYRRLYRARDFLFAASSQNITLEEMAGIACLSPNHFLRTFKQVFHQTPHQFLTNLRMERAKILLSKTKISVTEVCFAVGFESPGSFSWLFRKHFCLSPAQYRTSIR